MTRVRSQSALYLVPSSECPSQSEMNFFGGSMIDTEKQTVHILIGLPGAGKTTFYEKTFKGKEKLLHISKDKMTGSRKEDKQQLEVIEALRKGFSIVLDNTNCGAERRRDTLRRAELHGVHTIAYFFNNGIDECKDRNDRRSGTAKVPHSAIYRFQNELQPPTFSEGFKQIFYVTALPHLEFSLSEVIKP